MSKKKKVTRGNPAKRANSTPPANETINGISLKQVRDFLRFQRDEARRRNESEKWEVYLTETQASVYMSEHILTPGLGAVPREMMKQALIDLGEWGK